MTPEEADKIIAEFIGTRKDMWLRYLKGEDLNKSNDLKFSESLDLLIPVWEKLNPNKVVLLPCIDVKKDLSYPTARVRCRKKKDYMYASETITEAAAIATAKTIQALKETD